MADELSNAGALVVTAKERSMDSISSGSSQMVGIVSGNSLGLSSGSMTTLGQQGMRGQAASGSSGERIFVNVSNGNLVLQDMDEQLVNQQLPIELLRTYNSQGQLSDTCHGLGVSGFQQQRIELIGTLYGPESSLVRTDRDGARSVYTWQPDRKVYQSTDGGGAYDTLTKAGDEYVWIDGETQQREFYSSLTGRLSRIADTNQRQIYLTYDSQGHLTSLQSFASRIDYHYAGGQLVQISSSDPLGQNEIRTRYSYDSQNRLSQFTVDLSPEDRSITDGKIYQTNYTYDGDSQRIASIGQTDGSLVRITYARIGQDHRVASISNALGQTSTFAYDTANRSTRVTTPLGQSTLYTYDHLGQLESIVEPMSAGANAVTRFVYNDRGDLIQSVDPMGRTTSMRYDDFGNLTFQRDADGNTLRRTYVPSTQLVKHRVLTETRDLFRNLDNPDQNSRLTTRYVYDTAQQGRLRFVISPEGRVTEHRYDDFFGNRTRTIDYLIAKYPLGQLGMTDAPFEQQMIDWAGQQDLTAIQRTDFTYDATGNLQSETRHEQTDSAGAPLRGN